LQQTQSTLANNILIGNGVDRTIILFAIDRLRGKDRTRRFTVDDNTHLSENTDNNGQKRTKDNLMKHSDSLATQKQKLKKAETIANMDHISNQIDKLNSKKKSDKKKKKTDKKR